MVGVGDLHFSCSIASYLTTTRLHDFIVGEVQKVLMYAKRNGVRNVVFYGDICHTPIFEPDSLIAFLNLLQSNTEFRFIVMTGNHDIADSGHHSLRVLQKVARNWMPHVKVVSKPKVFDIDGESVNILPWPHTDTRRDALNVLHTEVKGSIWDSGRPTGGTLVVPKEHFCVAGHLHTAQVVGNVNFSGTLYQTNFAEKLPKYFHHVTFSNKRREARLVPHVPDITLMNIVVKSASDLDKIPEDNSVLCKIFVKEGVDIDPDELSKRQNVVKFNSFQNKKELEVLLNEDLYIEDDSSAVQFDTREVLKDWLSQSKVKDSLQAKTLNVYDKLFKTRKEHAESGED